MRSCACHERKLATSCTHFKSQLHFQMDVCEIGDATMAKIHRLVTTCGQTEFANVSVDQVTVHRFAAGMVNAVYRCTVATGKGQGHDVLVRLYGEGSKRIKEKTSRSFSQEVVTAYILGQAGLGPKVLAVHPEGRVEEFIKSKTLQDCDDLTDIGLNEKIARRYAHVHSLDMPVVRDQTALMDTMASFFKTVLADAGLDLSKCEFDTAEEWNWLTDRYRRLKSKTVFSHWDANPGNILVREDGTGDNDDVVFVDFELSGYLPRGYDIGNYFNNWQVDTRRSDFKSGIPYPGVEFRRHFIATYLDELQKLNEKLEPTANLDHLLLESYFLGMYMNFVIMCAALQRSPFFIKCDIDVLVETMQSRHVQMKKEFLTMTNWQMIFS